MRYFIKNITNLHSKNIVIKQLRHFKLDYNWVGLAIIELTTQLSPDKESDLRKELRRNGFVLQKDKKSILLKDIKFIISKMLASREFPTFNLSFYLSKELGYNYTYLANIFSEEQRMTIKQYVINQKIEKIKNMLLNEDLSLKQIALLMKYKSVSHLSTQFKKNTGLSPSHFKKIAKVK